MSRKYTDRGRLDELQEDIDHIKGILAREGEGAPTATQAKGLIEAKWKLIDNAAEIEARISEHTNTEAELHRLRRKIEVLEAENQSLKSRVGD